MSFCEFDPRSGLVWFRLFLLPKLSTTHPSSASLQASDLVLFNIQHLVLILVTAPITLVARIPEMRSEPNEDPVSSNRNNSTSARHHHHHHLSVTAGTLPSNTVEDRLHLHHTQGNLSISNVSEGEN